MGAMHILGLLFVMSVAAESDPRPANQGEPVRVTKAETPKGLGSEHEMGGVFAPALMPRGAIAVYGLMGAPDIGAGFRQGFERVEFEARLWFNYLLASFVLEAGGKMSVYRTGKFEFVPNFAIGIETNSGTRYYDRINYSYVGLRPRAGLVSSLHLTDLFTALCILDMPWSIPLTDRAAGGRFTPTVGLGGEFQLSPTMSALMMGQFGLDVVKEPLGVTQYRPAWALRIGLGFRLFK